MATVTDKRTLQSIAYALTHLGAEHMLEGTALAYHAAVEHRLQMSPGSSRGRVVRALLVQTIEEVVRRSASRPPLVVYIDLRYRQRLRVSQVAQQMGYSREYITRRFRQPALRLLAAAFDTDIGAPASIDQSDASVSA